MQLKFPLAAVAFALLATFAIQPAGAIDMGCGQPAQTAIMYAPPGAGEASLAWAPDCVQVIAGPTNAKAATITFTNLDAVFHTPVAAGCFITAQVDPARTTTLDLKMIDGKVFNGFTPCDETKTQFRTGFFIPRMESDKGPVLEPNEDGSVTVHFICQFHGAAMHGRIVVSQG